MVKDMTKGNVFRHLVEFSAPLMLGSICQQFYSVVDAAVLGRGVGVEALAAAGATGSLNFFVIGFVMGITQGFSILTAQRFGAGDENGLRKAITQSVYLAVGITLIVTLFSLLFSRNLLELLHTPKELMEDALLYLRILFLGIGATIFYNMAAAVLRALGDGVSPLVIIIISSVVNAAADVLFVMCLGLGVMGAGVATVLSQLLSGFMCLAVLRRIPILKFQTEDWCVDGETLRLHMKLGLPVGIMNSITASGSMILQTMVNQFGSVVVAAYTVGQRLLGIVEQPGDIVGLALATFVGQNLGARRMDRVREGVRKAVGLSLGINALLWLIMVLFGRPLIAFFISGSENAAVVVDTAYPFVVTGASMLWMLGFLFIYRFSLQSLGDTIIPMVSGGIELACRVAVALVAAKTLGFFGIALAEVSAWVGAGSLLIVAYYFRMHRMERLDLPRPKAGKDDGERKE